MAETQGTQTRIKNLESDGFEMKTQSSMQTTRLRQSSVIKASAGTLYQFEGVSNSTSSQYIHIFDSATVPSTGTVPKRIVSVPAESNFSMEFQGGLPMASGMSFGNSSDLAVYEPGTSDCWFSALYK